MGSSTRRKTTEALIPIYGVTLIDVLGMMIMVPLLPYLAQRFGASGFTVGLILTTSAVASVIAAPFWGAVSDRLGRKRIVLISQCVSLAGYLALATSRSLTMLFVARAIAGIGGGNLGVTQSYIADVTDEKQRDRAYALFGVLFGIGIVLGPVLGGFLIRFGLSVPFAAAAGIELVTIGLTLRFLPQQRPRARRQPRSELRAALTTIVRVPVVRSLVVRHFLFIFAVTYFFTIFALYVKQELHAGPEISSWLLACAGAVGGSALVLVAGPLTRRFGDTLVAQAGLGLSVLAYAALAFTPYLWAFGVALGVWAIGASCVEPTLTALISEAAPESERGAVMGFNDAANNLALIVGPPLGGYAIDLNPHLVGIIPACAVLIAFGLGLSGGEKRARTDAPLARAT
ncbi:MAG TPA: MFS transporter [Candidatus Limnocylindria bacterium]|jgi:DHA1 family tetracycline resistance protein-like MFS transporter|nr:MFS transporter [Candidatus Limnocylindria bacterium]